MIDATSGTALAVVSTAALTKGVEFLYEQAGKALEYWFKSRRLNEDAIHSTGRAPSGVFVGNPVLNTIDLDALDRLHSDLIEIRGLLKLTLDVTAPHVDSNDAKTRLAVDTLRKLLEAVLGQRLTFVGEARSDTDGPVVEGVVDVRVVKGYAAAVRSVWEKQDGSLTGTAMADQVLKGGRLLGVDMTETDSEPRS